MGSPSVRVEQAERSRKWEAINRNARPADRLFRGKFVGRRGRNLVIGEQFLPKNGHVARRLDSQTNLASVNIHDRDADVIADVNFLPQLPA
jgi:hypothetical protein